ncbi:MAG: hypothetical protein QNL33_15790 [Akkermansiaceae bacterium]|jgi:NADH dehydrogenase/NADH:ubiquinone oxidoreductase subunit G
MRKFFTLLWLLCPVAALYYHYNEGQDQLARMEAQKHVAEIRESEQAAEPDWAQIIEDYDKLDGKLPRDERPLVRHQIQLAKSKARLEMLEVAAAAEELTLLLQETAQTHGENAAITRATRETLGKAHYYAAYLLKTSGAAESEWRPHAERTRQIFRFLAEHQEPGALANYEDRVAAEFQKTINSKSSP